MGRSEVAGVSEPSSGRSHPGSLEDGFLRADPGEPAAVLGHFLSLASLPHRLFSAQPQRRPPRTHSHHGQPPAFSHTRTEEEEKGAHLSSRAPRRARGHGQQPLWAAARGFPHLRTGNRARTRLLTRSRAELPPSFKGSFYRRRSKGSKSRLC